MSCARIRYGFKLEALGAAPKVRTGYIALAVAWKPGPEAAYL